jgi:hypothetical protein
LEFVRSAWRSDVFDLSLEPGLLLPGSSERRKRRKDNVIASNLRKSAFNKARRYFVVLTLSNSRELRMKAL